MNKRNRFASLASIVLPLIVATALGSIASRSDAAQTATDAAHTDQGSKSNQVISILADVEKLVRECFPKAKITRSENSEHFEFRLRSELGFYNKKPIMTPQEGGILGDIELKPGAYAGKDTATLACEVNEGFHTSLVMAPYSKQLDSHLLAKLVLPLDVSSDFKQRFKEIINTFSPTHETSTQQASPTEKHIGGQTSDIASWIAYSNVKEQVAEAKQAMQRTFYETAKRHYNAASQLAPRNLEFYPDYYEACAKCNAWDEAAHVLEKLTQSSPENARLYMEIWSSSGFCRSYRQSS